MLKSDSQQKANYSILPNALTSLFLELLQQNEGVTWLETQLRIQVILFGNNSSL